jgi:RNA polymerase-binding protein DksA
MAHRQIDLDHFRSRLEEMRASTQREIDGLHDEVINSNQDDSYGVKNHPAEDATEVFTRERSLAIENELQRELERINHALERVADGTYGVCEVGGEEIPVERLEARPAATLCIVHQREQDAQANPNA